MKPKKPIRRIWKLTRIGEAYYDEVEGFVIRARDESEARDIAQFKGADEVKRGSWCDPAFATCEELTGDGNGGVIMCDFKAG